jgi:hypothetical protein
MNRGGCYTSFGAVIIMVLVLRAVGCAAQEDYPKGPEGGRLLTERLRSLQPEDGQWSGTLKILNRGKKMPLIPVTCQKKTGATNWTVTYSTGATNGVPAERLVIICSANAPTRYLYAKAPSPGAPLGEPKELTGAEADIPLAGSDFWLSDLAFEFFHWPGQNLLKGELCMDTSCYVLESSNPRPATGGYAGVKAWIAKASDALLQAEARGADGKLLKEFELSGFEHNKTTKQTELKRITLFNRKTGSRTYLEFDLEDAGKK